MAFDASVAGADYARDLGYLNGFLAKLAAVAAAMPTGAGKERLLALVAGEEQRWGEIAGLLGGARPAASAEKSAPARPGLTVGSLRRA